MVDRWTSPRGQSREAGGGRNETTGNRKAMKLRGGRGDGQESNKTAEEEEVVIR